MILNKILPHDSKLGQQARDVGRRITIMPAKTRNNFTKPTSQGYAELKEALLERYFPKSDNFTTIDVTRFLDYEEGRQALANLMYRRVEVTRYEFIPWIDAAVTLSGAEVLEIGCGTGVATIPLAEQGAKITALDVLDFPIDICKVRSQVHQTQPIEFVVGNAKDIKSTFNGRKFDLILFNATLEHMTLEERFESLKGAWQLVRDKGHICIAETPNRLWFFDGHTSRLPFYNWLPDELAFEFSNHSPRRPFNELFRTLDGDSLMSFRRQGRGISFHELDVALGEPSAYEVVSDRVDYLSKRTPALAIKRVLAGDGRRERLLNSYAPARHRGFFRESLNLIFEKVEHSTAT